ncbi:MAG: SCP2 sterol-binding domain-containing protein [bacterium]|nr:SCP2 sterol-binding domain-containing protein [bacterium]
MGYVPTSDPTEILRFHRKLIEKMLESESVVNSLSGEPGDVGITLADPVLRLKLTLDGLDTKLEALGDDDTTPVDPTLKMKWETALNFWLGKIDPISAFFTGKIKLEGSNMDPLFKLKSVVEEAKQASREVAAEFGWQDRS